MSAENNRFYTPEGWANTDLFFSDPAPFVIAFGGRGIGKTYGVLKRLLCNGDKFLYMRRTEKNIDMLEVPSMNPFAPLNRDLCRNISMLKAGKFFRGFFESETAPNGKVRAVGEMIAPAVSLTAFCRGIDGVVYDYLVYDEFIPQDIERRVRGEGDAFLNAVESIQRNRYRDGRPELKCILLSNTNSLDNDVLRALGAIDPVDRMVRRGKTYGSFFDSALSVYLFRDSPISAEKSELALYRVAADEKFRAMSLGNEFSRDTYEHVSTKSLDQYRPMVSVGNVTVYSHKSDTEYYVVPGVKSENRYTTMKNDLAAFRRDYRFLYIAVFDRSVWYANAAVKVEFERMVGLDV